MSNSFDYPLFPIFAFFGFILPLIPLSWHFKAGNSGTCFYIFWASLSCLNQFVNSIVWKGNVINWAPVWCDISIRITMAATVGLPASSFCIVRRLYGIAAIRTVSTTLAEKRRAILIDSIFCGLLPAIYLALLYIVQGHRFNIYEDIGCMPAVLNSIPSYFIGYSWPLLFGLASAVYCVLSLRAFARRRLEFARFVSTSKGLSLGQYFRLMALSMTEMLCTVPLTIFIIWLGATQSPIEPWISLANTHFDFSRVDQYPAVIYNLRPLAVMGMLFTRWASVACSLLFFLFFGVAEEARRHYGVWFRSILHLFGIRLSSINQTKPFFKSEFSLKLPSTPIKSKSGQFSPAKYSLPSPAPSVPPPVYSVNYTPHAPLGSPARSSVSDFSSTVCSSPNRQSHFGHYEYLPDSPDDTSSTTNVHTAFAI
ncbi:hypothetical protein D9757_008361 [Collybiopsis confluens]|uniref:Pheromone receptor n=1 Tax=Collybiopsis confluens TaxID=2823264 RepID=A0A8H5HF48_9AGAR|nr:hypothetical protein D9757_008361 [Collybiopsis confluens]